MDIFNYFLVNTIVGIFQLQFAHAFFFKKSVTINSFAIVCWKYYFKNDNTKILTYCDYAWMWQMFL
jgi:hypothetical protein